MRHFLGRLLDLPRVWGIERPVWVAILIVFSLLVGGVIPSSGPADAQASPGSSPTCTTPTPAQAYARWKGSPDGWEQVDRETLTYAATPVVVTMHIPRDMAATEPGTNPTFLFKDRFVSSYFVLWCVPSPGTGFTWRPSSLTPVHLSDYSKDFGGDLSSWSQDCCVGHFIPFKYDGPKLMFTVPRRMVVESSDGKTFLPGNLFAGSKFQIINYN